MKTLLISVTGALVLGAAWPTFAKPDWQAIERARRAQQAAHGEFQGASYQVSPPAAAEPLKCPPDKMELAIDRLVHCRSEQEAEAFKAELQARLAACGLGLHPTETKIVYCKDGKRKLTYPNVKFDFLGYCFRPRLVRRLRTTRCPAASTRRSASRR